MNKKLILLVCLGLLAATFGCADPTKDKPKATVGEPELEPARPIDAAHFILDEGSTIGFVGSKVTGSHDGGFESFEGEILVVEGDPTKSSVNLIIDTTSLWSDSDKLTAHLKSPDFFDVGTYPTATFASTEIRQDGEGHVLVGNLTLHGITKNISFPADIALAGGQVTASAEFAIKRFDFDMVYPGRADDLIRDDVLIKLNVVATPPMATEGGAGT